jgi:predicted O-methyltransferase YrrM
MLATINLEVALKIPGWMSEEELSWLAEQAQTHQRIVEVGCWRGRSTRALADNTSGKVWAVDTWRGSTEHYGELIQHGRCWLYNEFMANKAANVTEVCMSSISAARMLCSVEQKTPVPFDMVFLDGAHDYESVKADILAWQPLLSNFGLLCGHDYGNVDYSGVKQAVDELVPNASLAVGTIWRAN